MTGWTHTEMGWPGMCCCGVGVCAGGKDHADQRTSPCLHEFPWRQLFANRTLVCLVLSQVAARQGWTKSKWPSSPPPTDRQRRPFGPNTLLLPLLGQCLHPTPIYTPDNSPLLLLKHGACRHGDLRKLHKGPPRLLRCACLHPPAAQSPAEPPEPPPAVAAAQHTQRADEPRLSTSAPAIHLAALGP